MSAAVLLMGLQASLASPAFAAPVMIITPEQELGAPWWERSVLRPVNVSLSGVSVEAINLLLAARSAIPPEICYLDALSTDGIIGATRKVQEEIDKDLAGASAPFRRTVTAPSGRTFSVQAGISESCDGDKRAFLMVVTSDGKLHSFLPLQTRFVRLADSRHGLASYSSCFFCGELTELHYDAARDRFYEEYVGD